MIPPDEVYLDHNASSPLRPAVFEAMRPWLEGTQGNPSSVHSAGTRARAALDDARARLAAQVGARPEEIVFTSGGTEANNLALFGVARATNPAHVVTSAIEHPSVRLSAEALADEGVPVEFVAPGEDGVVRAGPFLAAVRADTGLASLQWINHETGAVHEVEEIAGNHGEYPLHVDAVQAFGRRSIDLTRTPIDLLTWTAHKIGGPHGIAALFVRTGTPFRPMAHGGTQEHGMRPGTQPVASAVGFARAAELVFEERERREATHRRLRDALIAHVTERFPDARVFARVTAHPSTVCVGFRDVDREMLLVHLDLAGVRVSSGAACASGSIETSPVLRAMSVPEEWARGALRVSFGPETNEHDLERLIVALDAAITASKRP